MSKDGDFKITDSQTIFKELNTSRKGLTSEEKALLHGRIYKLMQKGEFMNEDLADEVRALLE